MAPRNPRSHAIVTPKECRCRLHYREEVKGRQSTAGGAYEYSLKCQVIPSLGGRPAVLPILVSTVPTASMVDRSGDQSDNGRKPQSHLDR